METLRFKTTIKCSGCIEKVTPALNETAGKDHWQVDLQNPDRILTVSAEKVNGEKIKKALQQVGYQAEQLD